ncbi:hypothetical protein V5799_024318 [Amblyomma americanum]|uniref:DDE Tnp4 domain-containing protein n=1 Tax=Amblyomma americanum TaxID=6943 RepID=A0AAQ4ECC7_AMBAM
MAGVSASDPERVRLLILEEYYLLEKKKIVFAMHTESVCEEDVDTPALPGSFERGNHRLLLLEEYFLLEKKKLLEDMQAPRRWWVRPLWKNRSTESEFYTAMPLLISGDPDYFRKYYRMTPDRFEQLHALVEGPLTKGYLTREPLPSRMRLAITLRRCVESAFGVMASRFRIFRRVINLKPENVDFVVLASCALHNFLTEDECYMDAQYVDQEDHFGNVTKGQWRSTLAADGGSAMLGLQPPARHNFSRAAAEARDIFCSYFVSAAGAVPWQRASAGLRP